MRPLLPLSLLCLTLLAGCATDKDRLAAKNLEQSGPLKVHPALLGQGAVAAPQDTASATPAAVPPPPALSTRAQD